MPDKALKDQNQLRLTLVVIANILVLYGFSVGESLADADWANAGEAFTGIIPAGLGAVLVGVINAQTSATFKARIVFMRWRNPLPGAYAFTKYGPGDERVDLGCLKTRLGELPTEPAIQNKLWYRLYREVSDKPAIVHANKEYLFTRDYHLLSLWMLVGFSASSFWIISDPVTRAFYIAALVVQALSTGQAARNHGRRLVCSVLALSTPLVPEKLKKKKKNR